MAHHLPLCLSCPGHAAGLVQEQASDGLLDFLEATGGQSGGKVVVDGKAASKGVAWKDSNESPLPGIQAILRQVDAKVQLA